MIIDYPLVSVLMPLHNKMAYVSEAIESVLNQTYPNIELIVIDDGSKEDADKQELCPDHEIIICPFPVLYPCV